MIQIDPFSIMLLQLFLYFVNAELKSLFSVLLFYVLYLEIDAFRTAIFIYIWTNKNLSFSHLLYF